MALTYSQIKTFIDTYVKTNGAGEITGTLMNEALVTYLLQNFGSLTYDTTRPYTVGQQCHYNDGFFDDVYLCTNDTTGAFDSADWQRLTLRKEDLTQTVDVGETTISHNIGSIPHGITVTDSAGRVVAFDITEITSTYIKIDSLQEFINAKIYLIG